MEIKCEENGSEKCYEVWNDYKTQVIGGAVLDESGEDVAIKKINIQRNRRAHGIGSQLLEKIVSDYEDTVLKAWVFQARVNWYKRHGFQKEKENEDLIKMKRPA